MAFANGVGKTTDQNHSCFELLGYLKVLKRIWTLKPEM